MEYAINSSNDDKKICIAIMSPFVILTIQYLILISFNLTGTSVGNRIQLLAKVIVGLLYLSALPVVIRRNIIKLLLVYLVAVFVFVLNYAIFHENWIYLKGIIFSFFFMGLPSFIYAYSINDWGILKKVMLKANNIVFIVGIIIVGLILIDKASVGIYSMSLSYYMLLPAIIYLDVFFDKISLKNGFFSAISIGTILVIGSRGAIMCIGVFFILKFIRVFKNARNTKKVIFFIVSIIGSITLLSFKKILGYINILLLKYGIYSRSISLFLSDSIYLSGRDKIYDKVLHAIKFSPFTGIGLASDRRILDGSNAYVHNIFFEVLANFGIVFGVLINVFLICMLIRNITTKNEEKYNIIIIWISVGFVHLLVSSSYLIDFKFWIYLGLSLKLLKPLVYNTLRRKDYEREL